MMKKNILPPFHMYLTSKWIDIVYKLQKSSSDVHGFRVDKTKFDVDLRFARPTRYFSARRHFFVHVDTKLCYVDLFFFRRTYVKVTAIMDRILTSSGTEEVYNNIPVPVYTI